MIRYLIIFSLLLLLVVACAPSPTSSFTAPDAPTFSPPNNEIQKQEQPAMSSYAPRSNDTKYSRGNIYIQEMGLLIHESYPPQITLSLRGDLPTPCHQLRAEIAPPDSKKTIKVDVYTVTDPNMVSTEVLKPFQENIDLGTFLSGHYFVWVNGKLAGEFDS